MPASTIPDEPHICTSQTIPPPSTVALTFDYTFFLTIITTANFILMHAVMVTTNNTDIYKPMHDISKEYATGSFSLFFNSIMTQF